MTLPPPPLLIATGRDADVFALGGGRVLRRYRAGGDVAAEAAVMRYLAGRGFPVPAVYEAAGPDLVMQRVDGTTMLHALAGGQVSPVDAAGVLADLHARLHALPARLSAAAADRILHLDLHPDNVILSDTGPVLIDWRNATEGPPELDEALTALIAAEAAAGSYLPPELVPAARELLVAFLGRVGGGPLARLDEAVARRRANPNLTAAELARLERAAYLVRSSATG